MHYNVVVHTKSSLILRCYYANCKIQSRAHAQRAIETFNARMMQFTQSNRRRTFLGNFILRAGCASISWKPFCQSEKVVSKMSVVCLLPECIACALHWNWKKNCRRCWRAMQESWCHQSGGGRASQRHLDGQYQRLKKGQKCLFWTGGKLDKAKILCNEGPTIATSAETNKIDHPLGWWICAMGLGRPFWQSFGITMVRSWYVVHRVCCVSLYCETVCVGPFWSVWYQC